MFFQGLTYDGLYCLHDASSPNDNIFHSPNLFNVPPVSYNATLNKEHTILARTYSVVINKLSQCTRLSSCTKNIASSCIVCPLEKSYK